MKKDTELFLLFPRMMIIKWIIEGIKKAYIPKEK